MKRRIFASLAATTAAAAAILITGVAPASAAPAPAPTPALADSNTAARSPAVTPNESLPAAIQVTPAENLKVVATLLGVGKQVYDCNTTSGKWAFREPIAGLFTNRGVPAAIHGKGPFWASFDGSHVDGSGAVSPPASPAYTDLTKNVPWLKLAGSQPTGVQTTGVFSNVKVIQRIDTRGGVAPTDTCTAAATKAVDYTANYVFWGPK